MTLAQVLKSLDGLKVWGNGAGFDPVLLEAAYSAADVPAPWKYWNALDVRTLVHMGRQLGFDPKSDLPFEGNKHHALDDAIHQANYCSLIWQKFFANEVK
jgi:hypothetical protein